MSIRGHGSESFYDRSKVRYPNPAVDQLHVGGLTETVYEDFIYGLTGRVIKAKKTEGAVLALDGL